MTKSKQEYYQKQARARDLAIEWQYNFSNKPHSWWYCIVLNGELDSRE